MSNEGGRVQIDFTEQRKHYRVYFVGDGEFTCTIKSEQMAEDVKADVLDLSLGGVHIALIGHHSFEVGDVVKMNCCLFQETSPTAEWIELEIRWAFLSEEFRHIHLGCQFRHLSDGMHEYFAQLIEMKSRRCNQFLKEKIA